MQLRASVLLALLSPAVLSQAAVVHPQRDGVDKRAPSPQPTESKPDNCPKCVMDADFQLCDAKNKKCKVTADGLRYRRCAHTDCIAPGQHPIKKNIVAKCVQYGEKIKGNP